MPLSIFLIGIGLFGILVTRKLYERQKWYIGRVQLLYDKIDKLDTNLSINELYDEYKLIHKENFKFYSKIRMNTLWIMIHFFILVLGIMLTIISITNS